MQGGGPYPPAAYGQPVARGGQASTSAAAQQQSAEDLITDKVRRSGRMQVTRCYDTCRLCKQSEAVLQADVNLRSDTLKFPGAVHRYSFVSPPSIFAHSPLALAVCLTVLAAESRPHGHSSGSDFRLVFGCARCLAILSGLT